MFHIPSIDKKINMLKDNGYLVFVHPSGWRKAEALGLVEKSKYTGLFNTVVKENQMEYLNINGTSEGLKTFQCGTRFDWYVIKK